jgi:hypothetical protein
VSIGRRGFLALLSMSGAAALLPGSSLVMPAPDDAHAAVRVGSLLVTQQMLAYEVARALRDALGDWRLTYLPNEAGARLGDRVEGVLIDTTRYVGTEWDHVDGLALPPDIDTLDEVRAKFAKPVGALLADGIRAKGIRSITDLPHPRGGAKSTRVASKDFGISLRLVEHYDITRDRTYIRADLCGSTEAA